jgi:hypothetical protein
MYMARSSSLSKDKTLLCSTPRSSYLDPLKGPKKLEAFFPRVFLLFLTRLKQKKTMIHFFIAHKRKFSGLKWKNERVDAKMGGPHA